MARAHESLTGLQLRRACVIDNGVQGLRQFLPFPEDLFLRREVRRAQAQSRVHGVLVRVGRRDVTGLQQGGVGIGYEQRGMRRPSTAGPAGDLRPWHPSGGAASLPISMSAVLLHAAAAGCSRLAREANCVGGRNLPPAHAARDNRPTPPWITVDADQTLCRPLAGTARDRAL